MFFFFYLDELESSRLADISFHVAQQFWQADVKIQVYHDLQSQPLTWF